MSKKNLLSTRIACPLAISLLILGCAPGVWAQVSYNSTLSFSGSGSLQYSTYPVVPISIAFSTLAGSPASTDATTIFPDGSGGYIGVSSLNVYADVTVPNSVNLSQQPISGTYSISQNVVGSSDAPIGSDPGIDLFGVYYTAAYPPPSGTVYSGSDSASDIDFYYDGGNTTPDHVQFFGSVSLTLGNSVTETNTPDGLGDGNDIFSYTYAGSELDVEATIGSGDPIIPFTGALTFTTVGPAPTATPDSAPGLVGVLTLAGVCIAGAWQQKMRKA